MVVRPSPLPRPNRRLRAKIAAARFAGAASRATGRGGTSLPGKLLLALDSEAIGELAARLPSGTAAISATNGKTTTAAMVAAILEQAGHTLVHNHAGANMAGGVAGALLEASPDADFGLFEVDEFWLDGLMDQLRPRAILLSNLFRDQLDRYGELEAIVDRWQTMVDNHPETTVVLNADDPMIADLGRDRVTGENVQYFGLADPSVGRTELSHASDAKHCRRCGAPLHYDLVFIAHLGHYRCEQCGAGRPTPQVTAAPIALRGLRGSTFTVSTPRGSIDVKLPLPGLYNVYNALAAAALASTLDATQTEIDAGLTQIAPAFGRGENVTVDGHDLLLLLVKNPTGANEVLRTLALESEPLELLILLNDQIADGRDVSWIWDADYEVLAGRVSRVVCAGTRAPEMAVRLKYAGIDAAAITVEADPARALDALVRGASGPAAQLVAIPTYTAMLELRAVLVDRGVAQGSFV